MSKIKVLVAAAFLSAIGVQAQNAPNVSQVLMYSTVTGNLSLTPAPGVTPLFTPTATGNLPNAVLSIYTEQNNGDLVTINTPSTYKVANLAGPLNSAISANIGVALSLVPIASPASAVVWQKDPVTGANLPGSSNALGPIFTERADVIGKGNFHLGITHQNFHFTKIDGVKLDGISILYPGGDNSPGLKANTVPATFNMGLDIRLSQDLASLTYGLTNRVDVSLGLPMVHSAVASTAYNGLIYGGAGDGTANGQCWCINTFTPGAFNLKQAVIGRSSLSKTGFGDLLIRAKAAVVVKPSAVLSIGGDVRFPTGDADNYLGSGTTTVKPFAALSLYSQPLAGGLILSPHVSAGWQFAGKSVLAGQFQSATGSAQIGGSTVSYATAPFNVATKGTLPDVFSWAAGVELALGKRNTIVLDFLGDQIGWINGIPRVRNTTMTGLLPTVPGQTATSTTFTGLSSSFGTGSLGQYSGAFGYKARVAGNLVATFNMLVRLDNNGLTSRIVPLFGLSYAIGN